MGVPPSRRPSAAQPFFLQMAEDLALRLQRDESAEGREMAAEAIELAAVFRRWETQPPTSTERSDKIAELMGLQRKVMDTLTSPPSGP